MSQGNQEEVETVEEVTTPDILGMSIKEAEKVLKENGLTLSMEGDSEEIDKENTFVNEQTPNAGIVVNKGSQVYVK